MPKALGRVAEDLARRQIKDKTEISEIDAPPVSKELKKRWLVGVNYPGRAAKMIVADQVSRPAG